MQVALRGSLRQDAAEGEVRRICFDCKGQLGLKVLEDGGKSEGLQQLFEGVTCLLRPGKLNSLMTESS